MRSRVTADQPATTAGGSPDAQLPASPSQGEVLARAARRAVHHERGKAALLAPVAWLGTIHAAALGMDAADLHPLLRIGIIGAGAVGVLGRAERRGEDLPVVPVSAAVLWLTAASIFGPYGWVAIILWVAGIILAIPHWVTVLRRPRPARKTTEHKKPTNQPKVADEAILWQRRVVPNNPAFKDTRLVEIEPIPDGYTAIIVGEPGATRFSQLSSAAAVETIASAHQASIARVAVEEVEDGDASRARLTVIRSDENLQKIMWLEDSGAAIDPETGIAQIGWYFDLAPAHRQFWTRSGGAQMCVIAGGTGSGKSSHVSAMLALAHRCPLIATALLDPQGGSSQPDWAGRTHLYGEGHEETLELLRMLDFVMTRRAQYVAHAPWVDDKGRERRGKPFLLPGDPDMDGMTMLLVCVEELKLFLDGPYGKDGLTLLANGVRTWRKAGGSLLVVNQNLGLDNFGNEQSFRSNLLSGGSLTALRTGSSADHHMVGLPSDPSKLPERFRNKEKTHGLGYLTGVDCRPSAPARMMPVRDAYGIATSPAAGSLGERTLAWIEEYKHHQRRGRDPKTAAAASKRDRGTPTSGDVQAAIEKALTSGPMEIGEICQRVQRQLGDVRLSEIPAALRALQRDGAVWQRPGDVYELAPTS